MFTALEGLVGMGTKNGLSKTPTVASVLNLNSLSAPTCTAPHAVVLLLSWRTPDAQDLRAASGCRAQHLGSWPSSLWGLGGDLVLYPKESDRDRAESYGPTGQGTRVGVGDGQWGTFWPRSPSWECGRGPGAGSSRPKGVHCSRHLDAGHCPHLCGKSSLGRLQGWAWPFLAV